MKKPQPELTGASLRERREALGLTLAELAAAAEYVTGEYMIQGIETRGNNIRSWRVVDSVIKALDKFEAEARGKP